VRPTAPGYWRARPRYREREAQGWLHLGIDLAMFAQNAALAGEEAWRSTGCDKRSRRDGGDYCSVRNDARGSHSATIRGSSG
jgi:hypothetical protein